jgi:hypothetical protein
MKILSAFEDIPRIIMQARSKAKTFPLDESNPDSLRLHHSIDDLSYTLLKVLPELIKTLIPDTIGMFSRRISLNGFRGYTHKKQGAGLRPQAVFRATRLTTSWSV